MDTIAMKQLVATSQGSTSTTTAAIIFVLVVLTTTFLAIAGGAAFTSTTTKQKPTTIFGNRRTTCNREKEGTSRILSSSAAKIISATSETTTDMDSNNNTYDVIVIGGGSAGLTAAKLASNTLQASCVLIERELMGGDCTHTGCVPSKSFIAASSIAKLQQQHQQQGGSSTSKNMIQQLIQHKINDIYERDDSPNALEKLGISVIKGEAYIESNQIVQIKDTKTGSVVQKLRAKKGIILCTGATVNTNHIVTTIDGIDTVPYYTYETIWSSLDHVLQTSKHITFIGGGPIGCELAQAFRRCGIQVTIIAKNGLLMSSSNNSDPQVSATIEEVFMKEGITIHKGIATKVEQINNKQTIVVSYTSNSVDDKNTTRTTTQTVECDTIFVATGRIPRTKGFGLEEIGIDISNNKIHVNEYLQTNVKGIYAAGDCIGMEQYTHYAGFQGAIAARNILLPFLDKGILFDTIPSVTYTKPEIATIGLHCPSMIVNRFGTLDKVTIVERPLHEVDRAICDDSYGTNPIGFVRIVYMKQTGIILGSTIVAPCAGELICEIAIAMKTKLPFWNLATIMHPYPTYAMTIQLMAAEEYYKQTMKYKWLYDILSFLGL